MKTITRLIPLLLLMGCMNDSLTELQTDDPVPDYLEFSGNEALLSYVDGKDDGDARSVDDGFKSFDD